MKLSIVVPIYGVEKTLAKCLDSILAQTFGDYELILVDDGSRDGSPAIVDEYARRDARIVAVHKPNGGGYGFPSGATRRGRLGYGIPSGATEYLHYFSSANFSGAPIS